MKFSSTMKAAAVGGAALLILTGCATNEGAPDTGEETASSLSGTISGAGASSQDAAQQQGWIAGFQTANADVTINYDPSGSGAGRESFQKGAVAFAGSDRAFKTDEITAGPFDACTTSDIVEIPAYISPIAIVFNVDGVDKLNLDASTVAKIFTGEITKWNDPAIAEANADATLPDQAIVPVHRSDKSGTTGNFTDYLAAAAPEAWTAGSVEEWPAEITGGEAAQGTSGVVEAVKGGVGTIGYADASKADDLGTVSIKVGEKYVPFTPEAAAAIVDASPLEEGRTAHDLAIALDRTSTEAGVYPIVLVSYLVGCEKYEDPANAELVKSYFDYIVSSEGQEVAAKAAGSAPISDTLREQAVAAVASIS
ncbi:phosphate ABC transporter substrate-binding protein PstS [Leucobacter komagatae]|uniref:Phosphate-binding protein n=1 Tax=Leucobacter komagatae TaxID=55969 RepID=A0A0D0H603_9MICO|nr:phosphate ABC transporter substrate-binding protein [Leucobacter komagatae]